MCFCYAVFIVYTSRIWRNAWDWYANGYTTICVSACAFVCVCVCVCVYWLCEKWDMKYENCVYSLRAVRRDLDREHASIKTTLRPACAGIWVGDVVAVVKILIFYYILLTWKMARCLCKIIEICLPRCHSPAVQHRVAPTPAAGVNGIEMLNCNLPFVRAVISTHYSAFNINEPRQWQTFIVWKHRIGGASHADLLGACSFDCLVASCQHNTIACMSRETRTEVRSSTFCFRLPVDKWLQWRQFYYISSSPARVSCGAGQSRNTKYFPFHAFSAAAAI